jgi:DNA-binding MarR family transcriptional regulator
MGKSKISSYRESARQIPHLPEDVMPHPGVLVSISHAYHAALGAFEKQTGVHLTHWRVLYLLSRVGECSQKFIVETTHVDGAAITRVVKALEGQELVTRKVDQSDNRLMLVSLTALGEANVQAVLTKRKAFMSRMLAGISGDDLARMESTLLAIESNLVGGAPPGDIAPT